MKRIVIAAGIAALISGCATTVSQEQIAAGDAGAPPDAKAFIAAKLQRELVDPDSVKAIQVSGPVKCGKLTASWKPVFGWCISYEYNAKNRMGGYTGLSSHEVMVRDGRAIWEDGAFTEFRF